MKYTDVRESEITIISENTSLKGEFNFKGPTRIHGSIQGNIRSDHDSQLIIASSGFIDGSVEGGQILVSGSIEGTVHAHGKLTVTSTGRIRGKVIASTLNLEFGSWIEADLSVDSPQ